MAHDDRKPISVIITVGFKPGLRKKLIALMKHIKPLGKIL